MAFPSLLEVTFGMATRTPRPEISSVKVGHALRRAQACGDELKSAPPQMFLWRTRMRSRRVRVRAKEKERAKKGGSFNNSKIRYIT